MNLFDYVMYRFSALLLKRVDLTVDLAVEAINLAAAYFFCFLKCPNCCSIRLFLHHAFRHSQALIMSSPGWFLSGVMSFFALLKTRSHSVDIAGQDKVSRADCKNVRKSSFPDIPAHQVIPLKLLLSLSGVPSA